MGKTNRGFLMGRVLYEEWAPRALELVGQETFSTGVLNLAYKPAVA
jgi:hypothetical protein